MTAKQEVWGSRLGLILAMAGNAVGLGNFLRFPVQAIHYGGGAFIVPYLICFFLMGIPLLYVEWAMGRFGGKFGYHSGPFILGAMSKQQFWQYIGVFGLFCNVAVAAYYCYLESWTLGYIWNFATGAFNGQSREQVAGYFSYYVGLHSARPIVFWVLCLLLNTYFLTQDLKHGVERIAKIGMPLLIIFGIILAARGLTLKAGSNGALFDGIVGLNYLWTPDFSSIWSAKVWLAAAGQIFFTLSLGSGAIHCYASFLGPKDDVALNAMSAGWMNEFVEVCLGGAIVIPITVGYFGIDGMTELVNQAGGLGLGFRTLPYLFLQWGPILGVFAGLMWFGLLFFAGITSSLAMGTSCIAFLQDEFNWNRKPAAWLFGGVVFILGIPTILFFDYGVFDEFDYWAGTVSLVVFALFESVLFAWVFGMEKGWKEIITGADIKVSGAYKFIIKYITPLILLMVFVGSLPDLVKMITNEAIYDQLHTAVDPAVIARLHATLIFRNAARLLLLSVWIGIALMVAAAYRKRVREGRFSPLIKKQ
jgi:SNF family Na+-dependent transporter